MHELLSPLEMGEADRLTIAGGTPGIALMERAGTAVADAISQRFPKSAAVSVVAGPGNNGGDGFVAARLLADRGFPVRVLFTGDRGKLKGDAATAAQRWTGETAPATPDGLAEAWVIVDALFGAGLDRPVQGLPAAMIAAMNEAPCPVVAVDLPSGINGADGTVMGAAVTATCTVTFFRRKPGHVLLPGRLHCGEVSVADIGIPPTVLPRIAPKTFANHPALWGGHFPVPRVDAHKYARGHAVVVTGGLASTGAGRLAARGALRAGAGLTTIASPRDALAVNAAANLAIMVRPVDTATELTALLSDRRLNAVVLGPGGGVGERLREMVLAALDGPRTVVLDADALTSFADAPSRLAAAIKGRGPAATILTPHEGEFSRLMGNVDVVSEQARSKLERARAGAAYFGAAMILKGPDTVVASAGGRAAIAENAPAWLATAGAGDVLAGFAAGLAAQGMPAFEAAAAAVWLHGEAGRQAGPGLISEDLPEAVPAIYRTLFDEIPASQSR